MGSQQELEKVEEESKEKKPYCVKSYYMKTFSLFCFKIAQYHKYVSYLQAKESARPPWVYVSNKQST